MTAYSDDPALTYEQREIQSLLYQILHEDGAIMVVSAELGRACKTSLAHVDVEHNTLYFDELTPTNANTPLRAHQAIRCYGWLDGVRFDFDTTIIKRHISNEHGDYFTATLPDFISYEQRRNQYRIRVQTAQAPITATVRQHDDPTKLECEVADISPGGAGFILDGEPVMKIGDTLVCLLRLPDNTLKSQATICSVTVLTKPTRTRIGTQFVDMPAKTHAQLQRFLASVQRKQLRNR